jgi:hypothetical protein
LHDATGTFTTAIFLSLVVLLLCAVAAGLLPRRSLVDEPVPATSDVNARL